MQLRRVSPELPGPLEHAARRLVESLLGKGPGKLQEKIGLGRGKLQKAPDGFIDACALSQLELDRQKAPQHCQVLGMLRDGLLQMACGIRKFLVFEFDQSQVK